MTITKLQRKEPIQLLVDKDTPNTFFVKLKDALLGGFTKYLEDHVKDKNQ